MALKLKKTYFGIDLVFLEIILLKPDMCFCSLSIYVYIYILCCVLYKTLYAYIHNKNHIDIMCHFQVKK